MCRTKKHQSKYRIKGIQCKAEPLKALKAWSLIIIKDKFKSWNIITEGRKKKQINKLIKASIPFSIF